MEEPEEHAEQRVEVPGLEVAVIVDIEEPAPVGLATGCEDDGAGLFCSILLRLASFCARCSILSGRTLSPEA